MRLRDRYDKKIGRERDRGYGFKHSSRVAVLECTRVDFGALLQGWPE